MNAASLLTDDLRAKLRANGDDAGADHVPVVKFFNPAGAGTWLATELAADGDTLFGIADVGVGCPELGSFGLRELEAITLPFGLAIERDIAFSSEHPLSAWAEAARACRSLSAAEQILAAARLRRGDP
jgi:hypothetical protein